MHPTVQQVTAEFILAHRGHPYMLSIFPEPDGIFQQDNAARHMTGMSFKFYPDSQIEPDGASVEPV